MFGVKELTQRDHPASLLGRTLPSLLEEACALRPNATALNQWTEAGWRSLSNQEFRTKAEILALGFLNLGLVHGDRVALLMPSDVNFAIADMGCLVAGLVDVPIDLTQTLETIVLVIEQSGSKALIVANLDLLEQVLPYLEHASDLKYILIADVPEDWRSSNPQLIYSIEQVSQIADSDSQVQELYQKLSPQDLATLVYVPGEDGQWLGAMLTHENLSGNALAAFASLSRLHWGAEDIVLSFLPLTHVFARCLLYGHFYYGHTIYFSSANRVFKHLKEVQPTILATVPLLLERLYSKTMDQAERLTSRRERIALAVTLWFAKRHKLGHSRTDALLQKFVTRFGLSQWRSLFGNRLKYVLCGGAALKPELVAVFAAAGLDIYQGYGLTQASAIVSCNRDRANRAGTVGKLIEGVEIAIAPDQEILVRGAYVMRGYYQNAEGTEAAIDEQGWLHTGDLGALTADGFLQVTGQKKVLFKLASGKYIAPRPIQSRLKSSPLVKDAIVVGAGQKGCGALIVPNLEALRNLRLADDDVTLLKHPCVQSLYQLIVDEANCHQPYWAAVKRFRLTDEAAFGTNLTKEIHLLYSESKTPLQDSSDFDLQELECPVLPVEACPTFAQSLHPRFTTS
ncbi:AMP-dependent synthetase/ligase [Leptolyngbya sp. GGD]|uniref:AMP-dependent synthetase/ligase n=1 Tax=Leptolyngbya sp. GGD TaxID=2997907 RepID=UPI00227ACDC9|nr:AMP-binding protein [Leptolyngbya sp. GGD]MCY6488971.1 AMP-binding protein [Leptolyngbya sp. GGD]